MPKAERDPRMVRAGQRLRNIRGDRSPSSIPGLSRQQVNALETGSIQKPSMQDLCLLATAYDSTPNDIAEIYDYWHPSGKEEVHEEYQEVAYIKSVVRLLPEDRRNALLRRVRTNAAVEQEKYLASH